MPPSGDSTLSGLAAEQQRERLPVNPRRVKVAPEERKRVVRACNACNVRRVRCSGDQPCQRCCKVSRECEYPAPESDKSALKNEVDRLRKRCAALERSLQAAAANNTADVPNKFDRDDSATVSTPSPFHSDLTGTDDGEAPDGRLLCDPDGVVRYHGETSGATFLDHLKHFMFTLVPLTFQSSTGEGSTFVTTIGRYQTFDSRPLPNPEVDPHWLPSRTEMTTMLAELRYYIQDGNGDFVSGGIYWWGDLSNLPASVGSSASLATMTTEDSFRYLAFHHVCFALASSVGHTSFRHSEQHAGEAYFKRARVLIGNPLDTVRFTLGDVPVLSLMAFYLIELNRRDAAFMYLGLAVRIAVIHGAFRSCVDEASTRTMWTLYILDRWLSVLMGRPPTIADEAIKLPLPSDVNSMPSCVGLRAHVELSRISGFIVCETFKIAPRTYRPGRPTNNIDTALKMLQTWQLQLPPDLQIPDNFNHPDPSCCILHMAHNQLIALTTRPVIFAAVKRAVAHRIVHGTDPTNDNSPGRHIQACSAAAHRNLLLAQHVLQLSRRLLQAGLHFVFNAAVILLLKRIMDSPKTPRPNDLDAQCGSTTAVEEQSESSIQFAIRIFEEEAKTGTHYSRDCCKILSDLRALTDRYLVSRDQAIPSQRRRSDHAHLGLQHGAGSKHSADPRTSQQPIGENDALHEEMMAWMQNNGLQLQNSLLI